MNHRFWAPLVKTFVNGSVPNYRNLQRLWLSYSKIWFRVLAHNLPPVFCVTIPKSGTHLLERSHCLYQGLYRKLIPTVNEANLGRWKNMSNFLESMRPGQIVLAHLDFNPERGQAIHKARAKGIFLIRDLRDIVVSNSYYMSTNKNHYLYNYFSVHTNHKERIKLIMHGIPHDELCPHSVKLWLGFLLGWIAIVWWSDLRAWSEHKGEEAMRGKWKHSMPFITTWASTFRRIGSNG